MSIYLLNGVYTDPIPLSIAYTGLTCLNDSLDLSEQKYHAAYHSRKFANLNSTHMWISHNFCESLNFGKL